MNEINYFFINSDSLRGFVSTCICLWVVADIRDNWDTI